MRIVEQRRTRYGRHPGCEEDLQIKTTGSSGLEKKDRRYVADMDCGGCRHLPAGDAGHEDPGCAHYEGMEHPDPLKILGWSGYGGAALQRRRS